MRQVLKSGEVFHYFANKIQPSGRCSNTSFALPRAYSYATCIGQHIAPNVVALSSASWSVTTSKHQSDLRYATRHLEQVFVPDPDSVSQSFRRVNLSIEKLLRQASTAKSRKELLIGQALREIKDFNRFAELRNDSMRIEVPAFDDAALKQISIAVKAETKRKNEAIKERARLDAMAHAECLAFWRIGEPTNTWVLRTLPVALRINGESIETSYGANIPLSQAPMIWAMVNRVMRGEKDYEPGQAIGVYRLTKIRTNGSIVVGCHDIAFSELSLIATQLGI